MSLYLERHGGEIVLVREIDSSSLSSGTFPSGEGDRFLDLASIMDVVLVRDGCVRNLAINNFECMNNIGYYTLDPLSSLITSTSFAIAIISDYIHTHIYIYRNDKLSKQLLNFTGRYCFVSFARRKTT